MYETGPQAHSPAFDPSAIRDFSSEIEFALNNAQQLQLQPDLAYELQQTTPANRQEVSQPNFFDQYRDMPDDHLITCAEESRPHFVLVDQPDEYWMLFRQAAGLPRDMEGDPTVEAAVREQYIHEMEHAIAAQTIAPDMRIQYATGFFWAVLPDGQVQYFMRPSIALTGTVRKIDMAMIFAAPEHPSPDDMQSIQALGYKSAEEVREKYALQRFKDSL